MRRYLFQLAKFSVFALITYVLYVWIWGHIPYSHIGSNLFYRQGSYGHLYTRLKEIPSYGEVDILFVGSSRIYRGIDPRIFRKGGLRVFVLGSSSQTPIQSYVLLKRYLEILKPKLVVFDALPSSFTILGIESSLDLIANDKIDCLSYLLAKEQNDILVWKKLMYAQIHQWIGWHDDFVEPVVRIQDKDTYITGGYIEKELSYHQEVNCYDSKDNWGAPTTLQLVYFQKSIAWVQSVGLEYIIVNSPLAHYECFYDNALYDSIFGELGPYLNANDSIYLSDSLHFYDEYHLNMKGVVLFDKWLIEVINKNLSSS